MIISGATNISPREIEEILLEIDGIIDVAVVGKKSKEWGEAVTAVMVKNKENIDLQKLEEYCRENLSSYKIPKEFHFVESLPRNASGKVMKHVLIDKNANNMIIEND